MLRCKRDDLSSYQKNWGESRTSSFCVRRETECERNSNIYIRAVIAWRWFFLNIFQIKSWFKPIIFKNIISICLIQHFRLERMILSYICYSFWNLQLFTIDKLFHNNSKSLNCFFSVILLFCFFFPFHYRIIFFFFSFIFKKNLANGLLNVT